MKENTIVVGSSLEARPAALFVQTASKYDSNIKVKIGNKTVNAKSIMGMISLGVLDGQELTILAEGADEDEALVGLQKFLTSAI